MRRSTCSARMVAVATIFAAALSLDVGIGNAATPAAVDACSLLTKENAAAALGEAVSGPDAKSGLPMGPGATASYCECTGSGLHRVHLNLIQMSPDKAAMKNTLERLR
jgi:hypothetical protein